MTIKVDLKNPRTGETKAIKVGWSWTLFLFSGFLGIPAFLRKLNTWGYVFLAIWGVNAVILFSASPTGRAGWMVVSNIAMLGLCAFLGHKGNEMTVKNLLDLGWVFAEPNSPEVAIARKRWKLADTGAR